jgi:hypothetical protein
MSGENLLTAISSPEPAGRWTQGVMTNDPQPLQAVALGWLDSFFSSGHVPLE